MICAASCVGCGCVLLVNTEMSNNTDCCAAYSDDCKLFAYSSPDGRLKIWDTDSGALKQEYVPSSHLSAAATCLSWRGQVRYYLSSARLMTYFSEHCFIGKTLPVHAN